MSETEIPDISTTSEKQFQVEEILDALLQIVGEAKTSFRSNSIALNRDEILALLSEARDKFPDEVRAARWLIRERKLFIEKVQQEKVEIIEEAQKRAAELVNRVEVVRQAQKEARHILQEAREEAARTRNQLELYCEKKLNGLEQALENIFETVQRGKAKLQSVSEESLQEMQVQRELDFERVPYDTETAAVSDQTEIEDVAEPEAEAESLSYSVLENGEDDYRGYHQPQEYKDPLL